MESFHAFTSCMIERGEYKKARGFLTNVLDLGKSYRYTLLHIPFK